MIALEAGQQLTLRARQVAEAFLRRHFTQGGFSTYTADSGIRSYIQAAPDQSIAGWISNHPDVTAAVLLSGFPPPDTHEFDRLFSALIERQNGAGFIDSYWWRGPLYATALVLRAVARHHRKLPFDRATRILRALHREQLATGGFALGAETSSDPFTTALGLENFAHLAYLQTNPGMRAAGASLLTMQRPDGGWPGAHILQIPSPAVIDPRHVSRWQREGGGGNCYVLDCHGLFATALACHALKCWQKAERKSKRTATRPDIASLGQPERKDEMNVEVTS